MRYLWISCPYINFNIHTAWSDPRKIGELARIIERFKDFVNWVLIMSQHSHTSIERFRLSSLIIEDDYSVYRWINVAARRNVKDLDLIIKSQTSIELPFSLVNCESLEVFKLDLGKSALKLPSFVGFRRLKSLQLMKVKLIDKIITRKFIAACPLLEELCFWGCIFSSLKHLTIDNFGYSDLCCEGLSKSELKIACSSLVSFNYMGYVHDVLLQDLESLERAFIFIDYDAMLHVKDEEAAYVLCKILKALKNVEVLEVSATGLWLSDLAPAECCSTSFGNLKSLMLPLFHPRHVKPIAEVLSKS